MKRRRSPLFRRFEEAARRHLGPRDAERLLGEARHYSAGGRAAQTMKAAKDRLFGMLVKRLGPLGELLQALVRPSGRRLASQDRELAAAANLLDAFGPRPSIPARDRDEAKAELNDLLRQQGFTLEAPHPPRHGHHPPPRLADRAAAAGGDVRFEEWQGPQPRVRGNVVEYRIGGTVRRFKQDDPALTGEMIPVVSSNVHSIGFEWNHDEPAKGSLKVRFLQGGGKGAAKTAGPLYYYYGVHPDLFLRFRLAASKGKFVWDRLRVRGTVSGHQYPYELKGVTSSYVPRKATRLGNHEYYLRREFKARSVQTGEVKTLSSRHPDARVRALPNRGTPNRGR